MYYLKVLNQLTIYHHHLKTNIPCFLFFVFYYVSFLQQLSFKQVLPGSCNNMQLVVRVFLHYVIFVVIFVLFAPQMAFLADQWVTRPELDAIIKQSDDLRTQLTRARVDMNSYVKLLTLSQHYMIGIFTLNYCITSTDGSQLNKENNQNISRECFNVFNTNVKRGIVLSDLLIPALMI